MRNGTIQMRATSARRVDRAAAILFTSWLCAAGAVEASLAAATPTRTQLDGSVQRTVGPITSPVFSAGHRRRVVHKQRPDLSALNQPSHAAAPQAAVYTDSTSSQSTQRLTERLFQRCADKVVRCIKSSGAIFSASSICLTNTGTDHHPDRISLARAPISFQWNRSCGDTTHAFHVVAADELPDHAVGPKCGCVVSFTLEPPSVKPSMRAALQKNYHSLDIVLANYEPSTGEDPEHKYLPFVYGSSWLTKDEIKADAVKEKMVSIIASGKNQLSGHQLRHLVIANLASKYDVDVYGKGYVAVESKAEALKPYLYSVVIENSRHEYWISEKLIDAFLSKTVPIYWGSPSVATLFDARGMIICHDFHDIEQALQRVSRNDYEARREAIHKNYLNAMHYECPDQRLYHDVFRHVFNNVAALFAKTM